MPICKPCRDAVDNDKPKKHRKCQDCPCMHVTGKSWEDLYTIPEPGAEDDE